MSSLLHASAGGGQDYGITPAKNASVSGLTLLLWRIWVELSTQVDRAAGDVEGLCPVCEALFLDCDLMAAGATVPWKRIADKSVIDLDVRTGRG